MKVDTGIYPTHSRPYPCNRSSNLTGTSCFYLAHPSTTRCRRVVMWSWHHPLVGTAMAIALALKCKMAVTSKPGTPYKVGNRDSPAGPATTVPSVKQPFYDLHASPHSRAECQLGEYDTIWSNLKSLLILFFSNPGIS